MSRSGLAAGILALMLCGCATPSATEEAEATPAPAKAVAAKAAPAAVKLLPVKDEAAEVTFFDSSSFDGDLSQALRENYRTVNVVAPEPYGLNKLPKRLEKWLSIVKESGGTVRAQALPPPDAIATRGIIGEIIDLVVSLFDAAHEAHLYAPAKQYNAVLLYRKDTGIVETARFVHRAG